MLSTERLWEKNIKSGNALWEYGQQQVHVYEEACSTSQKTADMYITFS